MTRASELFSYLRCTECGIGLELRDPAPAIGRREELICSNQHTFRVDDYIPDLMPEPYRLVIDELDRAMKKRSTGRSHERNQVALSWLEKRLRIPPGEARLTPSFASNLADCLEICDQYGLSDADKREMYGILTSRLMSTGYKRHVADQLYASLEAAEFEKYEDILLRKLVAFCLRRSEDTVLIELGSGVGRVLHQYASCLSDRKDASLPYRRLGRALYTPKSLPGRDHLKLILGIDFERAMLRRSFHWMQQSKLTDLLVQGRVVQVRASVRHLELSFADTEFDSSIRLVCILFQTLGNQLGTDLQVDMLRKARQLASPRGVIFVSVFNAQAFDQAVPYYESIRGSVGKPAYWGDRTFLSNKGVYSDWFRPQDLEGLFQKAGISDAEVFDDSQLRVWEDYDRYIDVGSQAYYKRRALVGIGCVALDDSIKRALLNGDHLSD